MLNLQATIGAGREFTDEINHEAGTDINRCYQCGTCSGGCPLFYAMDIGPRQVMRLLQTGLGEEALRARSIWICATCDTCTVRCPREINVAGVMEALRIQARRRGYRIPAAVRKVRILTDLFLGSVRRSGRIFELGLVQGMKMRTGELLKDVGMGIPMLLKGKLSLRPHRIRGRAEIERIYRKVQEMEGGSR